MCDEFGNLKKKFRVKAQRAEATQNLPGVGRAGWDVGTMDEIPNAADTVTNSWILFRYFVDFDGSLTNVLGLKSKFYGFWN